MLTRLAGRAFCSKPGTAGSSWIYASKYQEIVKGSRAGKLQLCPSVTTISDVTLRMHSSLLSSHLILCEDYKHTTSLLYSLVNKLRHIEPMPESTQVAAYSPSAPTPELLQLSDHLKFKEDYANIRKELLDMDQVVREHNQIKRYNLKQDFRHRIRRHKEVHGFGYVVCLQKDPHINIKDYIEQGFDVTYLYPEAGKFIKKVLTDAETDRIPYEILPGPSQIVSAMASSGFPADRFGIQHYPLHLSKDKLNELLQKRKKQNFTVCFMQDRQHIETLLKRLVAVYGEYQLCFCLTPRRQQLRLTLSETLAHFQSLPLPALSQKLLPCILIVAPYSMDYNSQLKEKLFQKNYAQEQIQDQDTPLRVVKQLEKKIESLEDKPKYTMDGVKAAHYLLGIMSKDEAQNVLAKLVRVSDREAGQLIEAAKELGTDVLKITPKRR